MSHFNFKKISRNILVCRDIGVISRTLGSLVQARPVSTRDVLQGALYGPMTETFWDSNHVAMNHRSINTRYYLQQELHAVSIVLIIIRAYRPMSCCQSYQPHIGYRVHCKRISLICGIQELCIE